MSKMDKVNGIDLQFIFKKRGHSPETSRLRTERFKLLQPNKTRIVGKGGDNFRLPPDTTRKERDRANQHPDLQPILPLLRVYRDNAVEGIQRRHTRVVD